MNANPLVSTSSLSDDLRTMPYEQYLQTPHWQAVREAAIAYAGRCQVCDSAESLQVHHRRYDRLGEECPADVTVLCRLCHRLFYLARQLPEKRGGRVVRRDLEPLSPILSDRVAFLADRVKARGDDGSVMLLGEAIQQALSLRVAPDDAPHNPSKGEA